MIHFKGTKKADYVQSLIDEDLHKQSMDNFEIAMTNRRLEIKTLKEKAHNTLLAYGVKVQRLENKEKDEGLTIEEYKVYVGLLKARMAMMKDVI